MIAMLRLLGPQGVVGIVVAGCLALLLVVQKVETRHYKKQSARFEELNRKSETERVRLVADYAAAAETARAADRANTARVEAAQTLINRSSDHDFQARIARARAAALRLHQESATADRGSPGGPPLPGLSAAPGEPAQAAGEDRLPHSERLIATEQAIQLDELINWVRAQAVIERSADPRPRPMER